MKSIIEISKEMNCDPMELNKMLIRNEITVKTEFGIRDGWIADDLWRYIDKAYKKRINALMDLDDIRNLKSSHVPIKKDSYVYFLFNDRALQYVGQSVSLLQRMHQHQDSKKTFDSIACIPVEKRKLMETEAFYINRFNPRCNGQIPSTVLLIEMIAKRF